MKEEALRLLNLYAERRDIKLATTGNTPRKMSVVISETIAAESDLINKIYRSQALLSFLETLAGERFLPKLMGLKPRPYRTAFLDSVLNYLCQA